jgi:hypothetical protein
VNNRIATLHDRILASGYFAPFRSNDFAIDHLASNDEFINDDFDAIAAQIVVLVSSGCLMPVSGTEPQELYSPTKHGWLRREQTLADLGWRHSALVMQEHYAVDDLVLALAWAIGDFHSNVPPGYLAGSGRVRIDEIKVYLHLIDSAAVDAAIKRLSEKRLVRELNSDDGWHDTAGALQITSRGRREFNRQVMDVLAIRVGQNILEVVRRDRVLIFYSFQSDLPAVTNEIEAELRAVCGSLNETPGGTLPFVVERAVAAGDGAKRIDTEVFAKIERSDMVVLDVTPTHEVNRRATPNPNVLIELGYALAKHGLESVLLVEHTNPGERLGVAEFSSNLPFDMSHLRRVRYREIGELRSQLEIELRASLGRWRPGV